MTLFLLTVFCTFILVMVALLVFWKFATPVYRVGKGNIITLLDLVVTGHATEADWNVFESYPIRHDDELARIQQRCLEIAEQEYTGGKHYLFTSVGLRALEKILTELREEND